MTGKYSSIQRRRSESLVEMNYFLWRFEKQFCFIKIIQVEEGGGGLTPPILHGQETAPDVSLQDSRDGFFFLFFLKRRVGREGGKTKVRLPSFGS